MDFWHWEKKIPEQAYTHEDLEVFQTLSGYAALAIENASHLNQLEVLHKALKAAKFRAIRQMMNSLSHEIGNLMMIACGKSQILLMGKEKYQFNEEVIKMLRDINERGMVASEILKEVKDYHGKSQKKEKVEFNIARTLEEGQSSRRIVRILCYWM